MGPLEIILILIVGLIAFGPGKIPEIARNLGRGVVAFRKATTELTAEVTKEFEDLKKVENEPSELKTQNTDKTQMVDEHEGSTSTR